MKLIKLSDIHYVVVDDSEIKEGDWLYSFDSGLIGQTNKGAAVAINSKSLNGNGYVRITHSTQPIEEFNWMGNSEKGYDTIKPIPLSEVKALLGEVDVEKKAEQYSNIKTFDDGNTLYSVSYKTAFITGYNQALEDNMDRKWTDEDVIRIVEKSRQTGLTAEYLMLSLYSQTEWEVEFVDGKLQLK